MEGAHDPFNDYGEALKEIVLKEGGHGSYEDGVCLMEAVAFVAGEPHTDRPACADLVLGAYGRAINDWMTDAERQALVPLIPLLVNSKRDDAVSLRRAMYLVDVTVRQLLPIAMEAAALPEQATTLRALAEVKDAPSARSAASAAESAWSASRSASQLAARSAEAASRSAASAWSAWSAARSAASAWSAWSAWSAASASAESAWSAARSAWSAASAESAAESAESAESAAESASRSASAEKRAEIVSIVVAAFKAAIEIGNAS